MMQKIYLLGILIIVFNATKAQDDNVAVNIFEDTRIVNSQSVETSGQGTLKFIIAHRFGSVDGGAYEWFGLDQATIRIGVDYGIKDWLNFGIGRSNFEKTIDGFVKLRLIRQRSGSNKFPFTVMYYGDVAIRTLKFADPERDNYFSSRLFYTHQVLIARKLSDRLSLQIMPSLVHRNLVETAEESNDVLSVGISPQFKLSKTISLSGEYYYTLPDQLLAENTNFAAIGVNIHTNGHVFQLHFGNSTGLIEKFFIAETTEKWENGEIHFGFNITRDFQIAGRKHH